MFGDRREVAWRPGSERPSQTKEGNFGLLLGWVDFVLVVALSALERWKSSRTGKAGGHHGGTPKSKSTHLS